MKPILLLISVFIFSQGITQPRPEYVFFKNFTLIDGKGTEPITGATMLLKDERIQSVNATEIPDGTRVIDLKGMTIMPALINAHGHLGILKGSSTASENYTRENILRQLKKYQAYGVQAVLSLGTDYPLIFNLRDSSRMDDWPAAMVFTAGYGFGVLNGAPPFHFTDSRLFRPSTAGQAIKQVQELALLKPDIIKIWVDDFYGQFPSMNPEIYQAIISEAHKNGLRVAAHLFHLRDAKRLVAWGVDVISHSIRDEEIDDSLLDAMKMRGVCYIPTLSLDNYQFIYTKKADWIKDAFFKASLEPGVYAMITSREYLDRLKSTASFPAMPGYYQMALRNLFRVYKKGIKVVMGTDSGATPIRAQGFSEHYELELMTEAGLTPLQAIECATRNGAEFLQIDADYGTIEPGKRASFIILKENPAQNIRNTRSIVEVWKNGKAVSKGPMK